MISCVMDAQLPFANAFAVTTFSPCLTLRREHHDIGSKEFITDLKIVDNNYPYNGTDELICLKQNVFLCVSRNNDHFPLIGISKMNETHVESQQIGIQLENKLQVMAQVSLLRSDPQKPANYIFEIIVSEDHQDLYAQQKTESNQSNSVNSPDYAQITVKNHKIYLIAQKASSQTIRQKHNNDLVKLTSISNFLFQKTARQIDMISFSDFCHPKGTKVFARDSGFKTFNFTILNNEIERIYCNCLQFREEIDHSICLALKNKYPFLPNKNLYAEKTFTIISKDSCTDQISNCLQHLYRIYLSKPKQQFIAQIQNLNTTFTVTEKTKQVCFKSGNYELGFKVNSSYPQTSVDAIYAVFKFLELDNIVRVFQSILLEEKIFFISSCSRILGYAIEAFQSFIYPLKWVHYIVPQLMPEIIDYVNAPIPVIYGLSHELAELTGISEASGLFVYFDKNTIQHKGNRIPRLQKNLRKLLIKRLSEFVVYDHADVREYLSNTENLALFKTQKDEDPNFNPYRIRNIFFELLVFILKDYKLYYCAAAKEEIIQKHENPLKKIYDFDSLLKANKRDHFLQQFYRTGLYSQLIETKYHQPHNKWIRTLDKAVRTIKKEYRKQYIQQESDPQSDFNETEGEEEVEANIPKGCLNIIHLFSKQSDESKDKTKIRTSLNSNSPKSFSDEANPQSFSPSNENKSSIEQQTTLPSKDQQDHRKDTISTNGKQSLSEDRTSIPQLNENNMQNIVYVQQSEDENYGTFCSYVSYPYRKVKKSTAALWTKRQFLKFRQWRNSKQSNNTTKQQQNK